MPSIHQTPTTTLRLLVAAILALAVTACGTTRGTKNVWPYPEPPVIGEPVPPPTGARTPPDRDASSGGVVTPQPMPPSTVEPAPAGSAAVTALMKQARSELDAGQPQRASATLERALRIEPRNAYVWSLMAQTSLAQQNYAQAETLANKANSLARGDSYVQIENWRTIEAARRARGDGAGAQDAAERVAELQLWVRTQPSTRR
ncbi:MAG: tetratricopeptide repeat protein [Nevskiales bacterium]|nr:tetratricopeptide repeat protein [Nevskiales bacterium]